MELLNCLKLLFLTVISLVRIVLPIIIDSPYFYINNPVLYIFILYYTITVYIISSPFIKKVNSDLFNNEYTKFRFNFNFVYFLYTHTILINIMLFCFETAYIINGLYLLIYIFITLSDLKYFNHMYNSYTNNNLMIINLMQYISVISISIITTLFAYLNKINLYLCLLIFLLYTTLYIYMLLTHNARLVIPNENINHQKMYMYLLISNISYVIMIILFVVYFSVSDDCKNFFAQNQKTNIYEFIVLFVVFLNACYCIYVNLFLGICEIYNLYNGNGNRNRINNNQINVNQELSNIAIIVSPDLVINIGIPYK